MSSRRSIDVVNDLLRSMDELVTDYGDLVSTPKTIDQLIDGTAFFPGGTGLWRGAEPYGRLPEFFPESTVMFVGNYWFNENGFKADQARGREEMGVTGMWASMRAYIRVCDLREDECFFTNALMGLTPADGPAQGKLTGDGPRFREQCRAFFDVQVKFVKPRMIVVMGDQAKEELRDFHLKIEIPHPASLRAKPVDLDSAAKKKVARLIDALSNSKRSRSS